MTKFVLHGGFNREKGFIKDEFFQEMLKDTEGNVKLLLVYFAENEEMKDLRMQQGKDQFEKNKGERKLEIKIATEKTFIQDCMWADVIYFSGGRTTRLMDVLKNYENLGQVFSGKTIGGDSAGANALGQLSYSNSLRQVCEGLRILPFKIVVHYVDGTPNPLADIEPNLETLLLHEYETIVKYY